MTTGRRERPAVLIATTFPIDRPRGGGQLRSNRLALELARGADVRVVALGGPDDPAGHVVLGPGATQVTIPRSPAHLDAGERVSAAVGVPMTDLVAGTESTLTPDHLDALRQAADGAAAVILAEPYLHPALAAAGITAPVVLDAYNVEVELKRRALPATPAGADTLRLVAEVEQAACREAALIIACSEEVAHGLTEAHGADPARMRVIANGTDLPPAGERDSDGISSPSPLTLALRASGPGPRRDAVALFMGSWHPPNLDAVEVLIETAAATPEVLILSVGGHGAAFSRRAVPPNLVFTGAVGDSTRRQLLRGVDLVLNPMRTGSGTNLKLLEALAWEIPVVSSPFGTRGLDVRGGDHLLVAEPTGPATAGAVRDVLSDPDGARRRAAAGRAIAERHAWPALGAQLRAALGPLVGTTPAS